MTPNEGIVRTFPRVLVSLLMLMGAAPARAASGGAPVTLSHGGYLLDATDHALTSAGVPMTFRVFSAATNGTPEWEGVCAAVPVQAGYYAVTLGSAACVGSTTGGLDPVLDTSDLPPSGGRWLELVVNGVTLEPRVTIVTSPGAARALDADALEGHPAGDFALAGHTHGPANASSDGFLSAADWSTFNAKVSAEVDPKIGTLTSGKFCTATAGMITCTSDGPSGGSGGSGGQATGGVPSPVACGPTTAGYLYYDATVATAPVMKVCNGASYVTMATVPAPPGPPTGLAVSSGNTFLSTSWTAVASATSYEVGYEAGAAVTGSATVLPASGTSLSIPGLVNGTAYAVAVRSVAGDWRSGWSAVVTGTPNAMTTKTLDFEAWPTYDTTFFTTTTNGTVFPDSTKVLTTRNASGFSFTGATFTITFVVPAGVTSPTLKFRSIRSYLQVLTIKRNGGTIETFSPPYSWPTVPETRSLIAGSTYVLTATVSSGLNGDWVAIDDVVVTWF